MSITLDTVGIVARDMAATLAFYRAVGLGIPATADDEANVEVVTPSGLVLGFLSEAVARGADPTFVTPVGQSMNLQFACDTTAEVDAIHASLVALGHASHTAPWDAFWGQRFARVTDPDGRTVNFFAELGNR